MKKWENPELKNLALGETNTEGECEGQKDETSKSLIPDLILFCTKWDSENRCKHPNWGNPNSWWPCKQAPVQGGGSN